MEPYYYNKMTKQQQAAYHAILQGVLAISDEFQIPRLEAEDLYNVFFRLRLDHPEIFWVPGYKYKYYPDSPNLIFVPEYLFEKGKIKEHQKAMKARVDKLVRPAMNLPEWDKEKYIHDFICENIHYDKLKKPYSHEIIGPLGQGVGVCEGIAKSVKILCDALGIWCIITVCGNNPDKGIKYRHTWNIVKIGGKYYHLDATFDNTLGKDEVRYDYFNLDDKSIFRDHEPLIVPAPACIDGDHFYYKEKKLSFTKKESASGGEERENVHIPLARRIFDENGTRRTVGVDPKGRRRERKTSKDQPELVTGSHPIRVYGKNWSGGSCGGRSK